jgi:hypothetical protein
MTPAPETTVTRPRVEGDREQEILDATLQVLGDMGYDVDMSKADPYSLSSLLGARTAMVASEGVQLEEAMLRPIVRIDSKGTLH